VFLSVSCTGSDAVDTSQDKMPGISHLRRVVQVVSICCPEPSRPKNPEKSSGICIVPKDVWRRHCLVLKKTAYEFLQRVNSLSPRIFLFSSDSLELYPFRSRI
jgi:hypothetical protein